MGGSSLRLALGLPVFVSFGIEKSAFMDTLLRAAPAASKCAMTSGSPERLASE